MIFIFFFIWSWNYSNAISQMWFQLQIMLRSHSIFPPQTPQSSVLLEKLTVPQLVRKTICPYPNAFHNLSLYFFNMYFNIIVPYTPVSPKWSFTSGLPTKPHIHFCSLTCLPYPVHFNLVASFPYKLYYPICFLLTNWSFHQVQLSISPYINLHKYKVPSAGW